MSGALKTCNTCHQGFDRSCFSKDKSKKDGLCGTCKSCAAARTKAYYSSNKEKVIAYQKDYYNKNTEVIAARRRTHYESNKISILSACKDYRSRNLDRIKSRIASWKEQHPALITASASMRRAKASLRNVPWADASKILVYYQAAKAMDFFNPFTSHHVDHIVPLNGMNVSGLHVENNLQIITSIENALKGNSWNPA